MRLIRINYISFTSATLKTSKARTAEYWAELQCKQGKLSRPDRKHFPEKTILTNTSYLCSCFVNTSAVICTSTESISMSHLGPLKPSLHSQEIGSPFRAVYIKATTILKANFTLTSIELQEILVPMPSTHTSLEQEY